MKLKKACNFVCVYVSVCVLTVKQHPQCAGCVLVRVCMEDVALQQRVADICIFLCTALQSFPLCSLLSLDYFGAA